MYNDMNVGWYYTIKINKVKKFGAGIIFNVSFK